MKKLLEFLMALTMVLSLAACGGDGDDDKDEKKDTTGEDVSVTVDADKTDEDKDKTDEDKKEKTSKEDSDKNDTSPKKNGKGISDSEMKKIEKIIETEEPESLSANETIGLLKDFGIDIPEDEIGDDEEILTAIRSGDYTIFDENGVTIVLNKSDKSICAIQEVSDKAKLVMNLSADQFVGMLSGEDTEDGMYAEIVLNDTGETVMSMFVSDEEYILYDKKGEVVFIENENGYFDQDNNKISDDEFEKFLKEFAEEMNTNYGIDLYSLF